MKGGRVVLMGVALLGVAMLLAPEVYSREERAAAKSSDDSRGDRSARVVGRSDGDGPRKPSGWVGPWPPKGREEDAAIPVPGGGDASAAPAAPSTSEVMFYVKADPPVGVELTSREKAASTPVPPAEPPAAKQPVEPASAEPELVAAMPPGSAGIGEIRDAFDDEAEPIALLVEFGYSTVVLLGNGEKVTGALCGSCGDDGRFLVEEVHGIVTVKPRVPSWGKNRVRSNLQLLTDKGRVITFNMVEITGTSRTRTDRLAIRHRETGSSVVGFTYPAQLAAATERIEERLGKELTEREKTVVSEKASHRLETYSDVEIEEDAEGRALQIESVVTIGDETVIRMRVPFGQYVGDPVATLTSGKGKGREARVLKRKSTLVQPGRVAGEDILLMTLTLEGVTLKGEQEISIALWDKGGQELRSSVRRS